MSVLAGIVLVLVWTINLLPRAVGWGASERLSSFSGLDWNGQGFGRWRGAEGRARGCTNGASTQAQG